MKKTNYPLRFLLFGLIFLWTAGFFFPVLHLNFNGAAFTNLLLKLNYGLVCHKSHDATIIINNSYLLVCARCTGLYTGALIISAFLLFYNIRLKQSLLPLRILSLPMLIDALSVRIGLYEYSKTFAFITGVLCGSVVYLYILDAIENSHYSKITKVDEDQ